VKIQIWTGRMGGHARIAEALAWALKAARPGVNVQPVDIYGPSVMRPRFAAVMNSYDGLVARSPRLWRLVYHTFNQRPVLGALRWLGQRMTRAEALRRLAVNERPDVIVSVISDLGQLERMSQMARPAPPVVTVISDLVSVHRGWLCPRARLVVTPTEAAFEACRRLGVPAERLRRAGFPIRAHLFCRAGEPNGHRLEGGLRVLAMGGSSGSGRLVADVQALLASKLKLALTVVCGKNEALQQTLEAKLPAGGGQATLRVLGYSEDVPALMRAADLLLTKAGPSTMFEAVACGLPAIITGHLPGQEAGNAAFFIREGVALEAPTPADTVRLVARFVEDPGRLKKMRNAALAKETCGGAPEIAAHILSVAEGTQETPAAGTQGTQGRI
jgi:1,2-diacylglycerol 3-beta-galactosyltransferase